MTTTLDQAYYNFQNNYRMVNPPPERRIVKRVKYSFGYFYLVLSCIAIFAAARSGKIVYDSSVAEGFGLFSWFLAPLATIGIEGLVMLHSLFRPRSGRSPFSTVLQWGSVLLGGSMSAIAGLKFSEVYFLTLAADRGIDSTWLLGVSLSVLFGAGSTIMLWGFSEFIGDLRYENVWRESEADIELENKTEQYRIELNQAWLDSDERTIANRDVDVEGIRARAEAEAAAIEAEALKEVAAKRRQYSVRHANQGARTPSVTYVTPSNGRVTHQQLVIEWLREAVGAVEDTSQVPPAREIVRIFAEGRNPAYPDGLTINPASAQRGRNAWLAEMGYVKE